MESKYLYKTSPNYFFIFIMLIGIVAPAFIADKVWVSNALNSGHPVTVIIFVGVLLAFLVLCLGLIIASKVIYLTTDHLIIAMPLIFYKRGILYSEIKDMTEKEENIDTENTEVKHRNRHLHKGEEVKAFKDTEE